MICLPSNPARCWPAENSQRLSGHRVRDFGHGKLDCRQSRHSCPGITPAAAHQRSAGLHSLQILQIDSLARARRSGGRLVAVFLRQASEMAAYGSLGRSKHQRKNVFVARMHPGASQRPCGQPPKRHPGGILHPRIVEPIPGRSGKAPDHFPSGSNHPMLTTFLVPETKTEQELTHHVATQERPERPIPQERQRYRLGQPSWSGIVQAEAVRTSIRETPLTNTSDLITALKIHRKQTKLVHSTLASLRRLQSIDG